MKRSLLLISIQAFSAASSFAQDSRTIPQIRKACVATSASAPLLSAVAVDTRSRHRKPTAHMQQRHSDLGLYRAVTVKSSSMKANK